MSVSDKNVDTIFSEEEVTATRCRANAYNCNRVRLENRSLWTYSYSLRLLGSWVGVGNAFCLFMYVSGESDQIGIYPNHNSSTRTTMAWGRGRGRTYSRNTYTRSTYTPKPKSTGRPKAHKLEVRPHFCFSSPGPDDLSPVCRIRSSPVQRSV